MERFSFRESVILGYSPQRSFLNHPSSSPNSDFDFSDVFGGPPRRSSIQELGLSFRASTDSSAIRIDDETISFERRWSGPDEKPVFGEEGANSRRYPSFDFFDDIFRGNEFSSSSPRKHDTDPFSSSPGPRFMSPVPPLPPRVDAFGISSLPAQFSLPAKPTKGTDLPTFGSSTRNLQRSMDGASHGSSNYPYSQSPLSRSSSRENQEDLRNDVHCQSDLWQELSLSSRESSNSTKPDEADNKINLKIDSNGSEAASNGSQFHFSIYKWASKGAPVAIPLRGNSSRFKEKCISEKCSSANERIAGEFKAKELPPETPCNTDVTSFHINGSSDTKTSKMELDKQENGSLFNTITQDFGEAILPKSLSEIPTTRIIVEDVPGNVIFQNSRDVPEPRSVPESGLSWKTEKENSEFTREATKRVEETTRKNGLKESKVKTIKKSSAVFDVSEDEMKKDGERITLSVEEAAKAFLQGSPANSRDNIGKNRVRGKVKEFVKIFNQENSKQPKIAAESRSQRFRWMERSKFRTEDEASVTPTKMNEKMHTNNKPETFVTVDDSDKQSEEQFPKTCTKSNKSKAELKNSSASTVASIPDGSEAIDGDTDEPLQENFLIKELPQEEDKQQQAGIDHGDTQVIDAKIWKWSNGKERNIRSLLSTLQYVLWPESGWKPVPLVDIIEGSAVKRSYQKALLYLHPDKLQQRGATSHQKYIAEKVFEILQEAWTDFH